VVLVPADPVDRGEDPSSPSGQCFTKVSSELHAFNVLRVEPGFAGHVRTNVSPLVMMEEDTTPDKEDKVVLEFFTCTETFSRRDLQFY
jgi:hypothetical protein